MIRSRSSLTWLYDVRDGQTIRVRYDLRLRVEVGRPEAWIEPPSKVNDGDLPVQSQRNKRTSKVKRYTSRRDIMAEIGREAVEREALGYRHGVKSPLIDYVMDKCKVSRAAARLIVCRARQKIGRDRRNLT